MAKVKNEFFQERVVVGNISGSVTAASGATASIDAGVYIPKGAIVNGIYYSANSVNGSMSRLLNGTITPYVGTVALGTNDIIQSNAIAASVAYEHGIANGAIYVPAGGNLAIHVASSGASRSNAAFDCDVYVRYII